MSCTLIKNVKIINENKILESDILIDNTYIRKIANSISAENSWNIIDGEGKYIMPGIIDDQVHFREPGLTYKADIYSESRAALAGGITSFMEMPNTNPQTINQDFLNDKLHIAKEKSFVNYSFFGGVTNTNYDDVMRFDKTQIPGIKIFMGSSTGDMLVDNDKILDKLFKNSPFLIATHCEDEETIKNNIKKYSAVYGEDIPLDLHPVIRNHEACYKSSSFAVGLAKKYNTRLHVLHISTKKELDLFDSGDIREKRITSEACTHHLYFSSSNNLYQTKGSFIKWNPAIKSEEDRLALVKAVIDNKIDIVAHNAATVGTDVVAMNSEKSTLTNVQGTYNICRAARHLGIPVCYIGTTVIYDTEKYQESLIFEDSDSGIKAAKLACIPFIDVRKLTFITLNKYLEI